MNRSLKIFFTCACGAFIGTSIAVEFNKYFWWIGILSGGIMGYLSWNIQEIPGALKKTYKTVIALKTPSQYLKSLRYGSIVTIAIAPNLLFVSVVPVILTSTSVPFVLVAKVLLLYLVIGIPLICVAVSWMLYEDVGKNEQKVVTTVTEIFQTYNLISFCCIFLPKRVIAPSLNAVWWFLKRLPKIAVIEGRFITTFLILIHSDIRLLCATDATIGVAIGYLSDNVLMGALAGGILGVLNYEVVSKRILKVNFEKT